MSKWWTYGQDFEGISRRSLRTNSSSLDTYVSIGICKGDASTIVYHILLASGENIVKLSNLGHQDTVAQAAVSRIGSLLVITSVCS